MSLSLDTINKTELVGSVAKHLSSNEDEREKIEEELEGMDLIVCPLGKTCTPTVGKNEELVIVSNPRDGELKEMLETGNRLKPKKLTDGSVGIHLDKKNDKMRLWH